MKNEIAYILKGNFDIENSDNFYIRYQKAEEYLKNKGFTTIYTSTHFYIRKEEKILKSKELINKYLTIFRGDIGCMMESSHVFIMDGWKGDFKATNEFRIAGECFFNKANENITFEPEVK